MAVKQIDAVRLQPLQRCLDSPNDVVSRSTNVVNTIANPRTVLRCKHNPVPLTRRPEIVSDNPLRIANRIRIRRIQEVDPRIKRLRHDLMRSLLIATERVAEVVRAQAKIRHLDTRTTQFHIFDRNDITSKDSTMPNDVSRYTSGQQSVDRFGSYALRVFHTMIYIPKSMTSHGFS